MRRASAVAVALASLAACARAPQTDDPFLLAPTATARLTVDPAVMAALTAAIRPALARGDSVRSTPSIVLHALRLHGLDATFDTVAVPDGRAALTALTDNRAALRLFHEPVLVRTPHGARFRGRGAFAERATDADESHESQAIGMLAELGVPLSTSIWIDASKAGETLRDVFADTLANFHPSQPELEWAAVAIAHYLPPARSWETKFGETRRLDDVVEALLARRPDQQSCAGTHVLNALVVILRVDAACAVLTPDVRGRLDVAVRERVARAFARQLEDGSIGPDWSAPEPATGVAFAPRIRLLVTGHLVESILLLPRPMQPRRSAIEAAAGWLRDALSDPAEPAVIETDFCPRTHATRVVKLLHADVDVAPAAVTPRGG